MSESASSIALVKGPSSMVHGIPFDALRSFETSDGSEGRFVSIESLEENGSCSIQDLSLIHI